MKEIKTVKTIDVDIVVIGGGIIGLAVARELSLQSSALKIVIIEKEKILSSGISSRNSEVIHAGLYYPKSYLKSALCVRGRELLYEYCRRRQVPHKKIGKIVVAHTDEEHEFLHALALRAEYNGVNDLTWLTRSKLAELEPAVVAKGSFLSPSTGIVNVSHLAQALEADTHQQGVDIALNTEVLNIESSTQGWTIVCSSTHSPESSYTIHAGAVVNASGLHAIQLAKKIIGFPEQQLPAMVLAKGDYFSYSGKNPFRHLIYPVPMGQPLSSPNAQHTGLGIHATIDLQNQLRFGPDIEIVETETYRIDEQKRSLFAETIQRYFPDLDKSKLQPAYAGIRPRLLSLSKNKIPDFVIQSSAEHGLKGLVNLFGIESPGITSCLAIAQRVADLLVHK